MTRVRFPPPAPTPFAGSSPGHRWSSSVAAGCLSRWYGFVDCPCGVGGRAVRGKGGGGGSVSRHGHHFQAHPVPGAPRTLSGWYGFFSEFEKWQKESSSAPSPTSTWAPSVTSTMARQR